MKGYAIIFVIAVVAGFLAGRHVVNMWSIDAAGSAASEGDPGRKYRAGAAGAGDGEAVPRLVRRVSTETLDSIIELGDAVSYADLALWLLDADGEEIAEYWRRCSAGTPTTDKKRLLFFNWTRVDPQGAIAATAGTDDANLVWWAWAASDPAGALSAAGTPEEIKRVAKGIGEFQPDWLKEHFSDIPEEARGEALNGLTTWRETDDPAGMLDFLRENGRGFNSHIFKSFALKDPWAAYDWLEKNRMLEPSRYASHEGAFEILIGQMKSSHPDDLERMASMMSPGKMKRTLEDAVFENLLATDAEKALKKARENESPLMAARLLAKIASRALSSEPEKAFEIAGEILMNNRNGLCPRTKVLGPGGWSYSNGGEGETSRFFEELLGKDPARVLDMAAGAASESPGAAFRSLAVSWANSDTAGYADWVNLQTEPAIRAPAIQSLVMKLAEVGSFHEAAEWAVSSPVPEDSLRSLVWMWGRKDPEEAKAWFQEVEIPDRDRRNYLNQLEQFSR